MRVALALVVLTGALASSAQTTASKPAAPPPRKPATPEAKADAEVEAEIKRRFARSKASEDNFTVKVRNGVATIEGRTNVPQRKGSATRMARSAGAKKVNNLIEVSAAARQKAAESLQKRRVQVTRSDRQ
jgi:osmotically-inducible protein OsmY